MSGDEKQQNQKALQKAGFDKPDTRPKQPSKSYGRGVMPDKAKSVVCSKSTEMEYQVKPCGRRECYLSFSRRKQLTEADNA